MLGACWPECAVRNPRAMRNATVMNVFFFYGAPLVGLGQLRVRKQSKMSTLR
jgi:hypothetical protein